MHVSTLLAMSSMFAIPIRRLSLLVSTVIVSCNDSAPLPCTPKSVSTNGYHKPVSIGSLPHRQDDEKRVTLQYRPAQRVAMNVSSGRSPKRAYSENLNTSPPRGERKRSPSTPVKYEQKQTLPTVHENTPPQ